MINKDNYKYFNLSAIEIACNIPKRTIIQSIQGLRKLPTKHSDKLNEFLNSLFDVAPTTEVKPIKEVITKPAKSIERGACVNIKDYKLLLSGKYSDKQGNKVSLKKVGDKYYLDE